MRGRVFSRFRGSYSICVDVGRDPTNGKRRQHFESVKGTRKEAEKRLNELLHQLGNGTFIKPAKTTVKDYLESLLNDYCKPNLSPKSTESYCDYMVHTYHPRHWSNSPYRIKITAYPAPVL